MGALTVVLATSGPITSPIASTTSGTASTSASKKTEKLVELPRRYLALFFDGCFRVSGFVVGDSQSVKGKCGHNGMTERKCRNHVESGWSIDLQESRYLKGYKDIQTSSLGCEGMEKSTCRLLLTKWKERQKGQ